MRHKNLASHAAQAPAKLLAMKDVTDFFEIASGNFGKVYLSIFEGCLVVVKVPKASNMEAQMEEYNILARLERHRNVLSLIGGILAPNKQVWLVCPFMAGGSLSERMDADPSWGRSDARRTLVAVADMFAGLAHLHAQGLCHRDCTCVLNCVFVCWVLGGFLMGLTR